MSIINPFKVSATNKINTNKIFNNITDVIVDELVIKHSDLVTGVQEGTKTRALLEAEIRTIIAGEKFKRR